MDLIVTLRLGYDGPSNCASTIKINNAENGLRVLFATLWPCITLQIALYRGNVSVHVMVVEVVVLRRRRAAAARHPVVLAPVRLRPQRRADWRDRRRSWPRRGLAEELDGLVLQHGDFVVEYPYPLNSVIHICSAFPIRTHQ